MLPNADRAIVDVAKLRDYCLNEAHPLGKHKARVFKSRLGLTRSDADHLRALILVAATRESARRGLLDGYGQRYVLDFLCVTPAGSADVRTTWIVLAGDVLPRLTSCYVL